MKQVCKRKRKENNNNNISQKLDQVWSLTEEANEKRKVPRTSLNPKYNYITIKTNNIVLSGFNIDTSLLERIILEIIQVFITGYSNWRAFRRRFDKNLTIHRPYTQQFVVPPFRV